MGNERERGKGGFEREETIGGRELPELDPRYFVGIGQRADAKNEASQQGAHPARPNRRPFRATLSFIFGGPISAFNAANIAEGASAIGDLATRIRHGPGADPRVRVREDRTLDLGEMAFKARVPVSQVKTMLWSRQQQTAKAVYYYALGAVSFFGVWVYEALSTPAYARVAYVVILMMISGLFVLSAFYNALVNWQIRTLRLGTWREFLSTEESWWPSWKLAFPTIYWLAVQVPRIVARMMQMAMALLGSLRR